MLPRPSGSEFRLNFDRPGREKYCDNGGMPFAHHHGVGLPGVQDGDDGPSSRSLEHAVIREKSVGVRDSRPLGAEMRSSGSEVSNRLQAKYCHNGGMALAHHHGELAAKRVPHRGVRDRRHGHRRGPQKAAYLQGKMLGCPRFTSFGVRDGLVCLPLADARSTDPTGAWPSPTHHGVRLPRGPRWR